MKFAVIDTSSILFGFANSKDVFEIIGNQYPGYKEVISLGVLNELSRAALNRGKKGSSAKAAIESIKYKNVYVEDIDYSVDRWVFSKATDAKGSIAITNDSELYKKLRTAGISCFKLTRDGKLR